MWVVVEDEGQGLAAEVQLRLFEPFVSTKPAGSGLGLYVCHHIVGQHGGEIEVESEKGRGTTMRVWLPVE